ncbi:hypothetical protein PPERSA_05883 [Pseudocohnilembus persalinus]|uniref:4-hydroxybenzoate polyprenyltransferase, mitochondrial n=1 Tax=Pseudocohnilembus persalinus TaxID=266149 RepID=A0A0V0R422_PSEPJ|nr:hypothetical protein PPERSA_05883 [Pseudocohnilembus persalinus]|eukprot:KRX09214.1 hypothetical protein PPERSA_05883 [Pseudocohnilembus persalinus]
MTFLNTGFGNKIQFYCSSQQKKEDENIQQQQSQIQKQQNPHFLYKNLPQKYHPYLDLARIDKPIGYMLLYWPCLWGLALGQPQFEIFYLGFQSLNLLAGAVFLRTAGCIVNDMWDIEFDKKVERTKDRPLAAGTLNLKQAGGFLFLNLAGGLLVLTSMNWISIALSFAILPGVVLYPYMKRITYYPQVVLGIVFNWGVPVGYSLMSGTIDYGIVGSTYLAGIAWTLIYDTIYAHQDKKWDIIAGVKSTALAWGDNTKTITTVLNTLAFGLMCNTGYLMDFNPAYYMALAGGHGYLQYLIQRFNIDDPESCGQTFRDNTVFGKYIFGVFALFSFLKSLQNKQEVQNVQKQITQKQ